MQRRHFIRRFFGFLGVSATGSGTKASDRNVLIQVSPIAGFQFHDGEAVWPTLTEGTELSLVRESANEHDADAVAVHFRGHKLGYVPRAENKIVARMLDQGQQIEATVERLVESDDPWKRISIRLTLL